MTSEGLSLAWAPLAVASRERSRRTNHFIRACLLAPTSVPPSVGEKGQGRSARRLCWAPRVVKRELKPVSVLDATALRLEPRQPFALVEIEEHELDWQRDLLFRRGNLVKD